MDLQHDVEYQYAFFDPVLIFALCQLAKKHTGSLLSTLP